MGIWEGLKMFWNTITGKTASADIAEADEEIRFWLSVYGDKEYGAPDWLEYDFVSLDGRKHMHQRNSLRAGKIVASELAGLVWAEEPQIFAGKKTLAILEQNHFFKNMPALTEKAAAGGGGVLKLRVKDGEIKIDYVQADSFIPVSWDSGGITEGDFIDKQIFDGKTFIRVEKHRRAVKEDANETDGTVSKTTGYEISSDVYELDSGGKVLTKRDALALEKFGVSPEPVFIESPVPMFFYFRNPEANNLHTHSPLGISIYANAIPTIKALDIAFDALETEIVLGKKRIIVPTSAIKKVIDPETGKQLRYFDPAEEIFQAFDSEEVPNLKISDNSVELRIEEIKLAIQTLLNILSVQVGFSSGYLAFDGVSVKTATEVISENSKTFKTKQGFENSIGDAIVGICRAIQAIGPLYGVDEHDDEIKVEWNDSIIEDRASRTKYWTDRYTAGTCTLEDYLVNVDGMTEENAKAKASAIREQRKTVDVNSIFNGGKV